MGASLLSESESQLPLFLAIAREARGEKQPSSLPNVNRRVLDRDGIKCCEVSRRCGRPFGLYAAKRLVRQPRSTIYDDCNVSKIRGVPRSG